MSWFQYTEINTSRRRQSITEIEQWNHICVETVIPIVESFLFIIALWLIETVRRSKFYLCGAHPKNKDIFPKFCTLCPSEDADKSEIFFYLLRWPWRGIYSGLSPYLSRLHKWTFVSISLSWHDCHFCYLINFEADMMISFSFCL